MPPECWLARFSDVPCDGRLIRAHLIPRQLLKRERYEWAIEDPRTFVFACGGPTGIGGHHGMLDTARTLRVPFSALPPEMVSLAAELGLDWWLEREFDRGRNIDLGMVAAIWPTPNSRDWKDSGPSQGTRKSPNLGTVVHSAPLMNGADCAPVPTAGLRSREPGGQLNPTWVEWLMGFPLGWTALEASVTRLSRRSRSGSGGE